ncbi:MAG TPA: Re/Si-specific NAD(P)(+) transhydrogenase subunit alpha [Candidatus Dormibacteraeota bacterium]
MRIGVAKELAPGERRTALVPESAARLIGAGAEVVAEKGTGDSAFFSDASYREVGVTVLGTHRQVLTSSDLLLKVRPPLTRGQGSDEVGQLKPGSVLVGMLQPLAQPLLMEQLAKRGVTAFSLDRLPRISRAQDMDVLSSMSTVSGYHAVLMAASRLPRFFPLLMTAAGTVTPARVLVLGAGVAGLQAIATARRLGGVVRAFDVRPAVKEQVESLGAQFVDVGEPVQAAEGQGGYAAEVSAAAQHREQEALAREVSEADVVISTALVPGRRAPILVTKAAVAKMRPGSVIVDLAAEAGGNCELTEPGQEVEKHGVWILGPLDLPSRMAYHASQLYSRNLTRFALALIRDGRIQLNFDDEVIAATCVTHEGKVREVAT